MDFAKLKNRQKQSRAAAYKLADEQAEDQIFTFFQFYDLDMNFEIEGYLDDSKEDEQKTKDERQAGIGMKQIVMDMAHFIKMGTLEISETDGELEILHRLENPIGENSENSKAMDIIVYQSVKPKHTEKMLKLKDDKYTFSMKAEHIMNLTSDQFPARILEKMSIVDRRAARNIGTLLLMAQ